MPAKIGWCVIIWCLDILIPFCFLGLVTINENFHAFAAAKTNATSVFSLEVRGQPLSIVLAMISRASGYTISFSSTLGDSPVSVEFQNVTIHEAINRVLRPYDHYAVWDDKNKKLDLVVFDDKNPPLSITGKLLIFEPATKTTTQ